MIKITKCRKTGSFFDFGNASFTLPCSTRFNYEVKTFINIVNFLASVRSTQL